MTTSDNLTARFCTDEDIVVKAGGDFINLCPRYQVRAYGNDGVIPANSFTMTSSSATFTDDVTDGNIILLTKPVTTFRTAGEIMVIDSVPTMTSVIVRRI